MPAESNRNLNTLFKYTYFYILLAYFNRNIVKTLNQACRSLMGLRLVMSVSDGSLIRRVCRSLIRHVGLGWDIWVSDEACRSLRWVSNHTYRSAMGLRTGMLLSDGSSIVIIFRELHF